MFLYYSARLQTIQKFVIYAYISEYFLLINDMIFITQLFRKLYRCLWSKLHECLTKNAGPPLIIACYWYSQETEPVAYTSWRIPASIAFRGIYTGKPSDAEFRFGKKQPPDLRISFPHSPQMPYGLSNNGCKNENEKRPIYPFGIQFLHTEPETPVPALWHYSIRKTAL
jgi:hypothetical protein